MLAVVVLPCAPATAIVRRSALSSPSSVGARQQRQPALERRQPLGVLGADRGRADDLDVIAGRHVLGAMADLRLEHAVGARAPRQNGELARSEPLTVAPSAPAARA